MEAGIKISQADDVTMKVKELTSLLNSINETKFSDEVAICALNLLGKSFSNPITIQNCSVNSDSSIDNSVQKYYKGSINSEETKE